MQMQESLKNNEGAKNLSIYKRSEKVTRHLLMVARLLMRKREWVVLGWAEVFPRPACPEPASWEHGARPGDPPCSLFNSSTYVWCMHAEVMLERDVEHNFQQPPARASCSRQPGKSVDGYCTRRRRWRTQITRLLVSPGRASIKRVLGWTGGCHSLGQALRNLLDTGRH